MLASAGIKRTLFASSSPEKLVIWAVACTAFIGFFRLGEILPESARSFDTVTDVAWGNISADSQAAPRMIQIHLKKSKCDQFGVGSDIVVGATGSDLCPVRAILDDVAGERHPARCFLS